MTNYIHSGYYGLYGSPFNLKNEYNKTSIYCISSRFNTAMVIIPLAANFFRDVINIVRFNQVRKIYLVATDIGIMGISDYFLTWKYITFKLRRKCTILSKYLPENFISDAFKADIERNIYDRFNIEIYRSNIDVTSINIELTKNQVKHAAPFLCDVVVEDGYKKRLITCEMNKHKAKFLGENPNIYDEIHMPYIEGPYGGWTYHELIKEYPILSRKVIVNQFQSDDEWHHADKVHVPVGGVFKYDFIQAEHVEWKSRT